MLPVVNSKEITLLVELGLTTSEARVFLVLTQIGTAQIGMISKGTGIHREHLYQITRSLESKGLIEKELGLVSKYRAIALDEILPSLISRKQQEIFELKVKADTILKEYKNRQQHTRVASKSREEQTQFFMIPKKEAIIQRMKEATQKSQKSIDIVTSWKRFSPAVIEFADDYMKALKRGVKIRIAIEKPPKKQVIMDIVQSLTKSSDFKIRFLEPPKAIISIYDRKQAMISTSVTAELSSTSVLMSSNTCFVELTQNYFDTQWNRAQKESAPSLKNLIVEKSCQIYTKPKKN